MKKTIYWVVVDRDGIAVSIWNSQKEARKNSWRGDSVKKVKLFFY